MIYLRSTGFCRLGFLSGFIYPLLSSTLALFLLDRGLSITQGLTLSFVTLPYAFKPIVVVVYQRYFERCRFFTGKSSWLGWIVVTQAMVGGLLLLLAAMDRNLLVISTLGLAIGLCGAFSDALIDGARIRHAKTKALASRLLSRYQVGYRLGASISGAAFIGMSFYINWAIIYAVAACVVWSVAAVLLLGKVGRYGDRSRARYDEEPRAGVAACLAMVCNFSPSFFIWIAIFRLPDSLVQFSRHALLISEGASRQGVAAAEAMLGLSGFLIGIFVGGLAWARGSIRTSLLLGMNGQILALTILCMLGAKIITIDPISVATSIFIFDCTSSLSGTVFVLYLSHFARSRYEALDYSILVSCAMLSASLLRPLLAYIGHELLVTPDHHTLVLVIVLAILLGFACIRGMTSQHQAWRERAEARSGAN